MKSILTAAALLCFSTLYSQDSSMVHQIDSLVAAINNSQFEVHKDSIIRNLPEYGIYSKTYLTTIMNGKKLLKYTNDLDGATTLNGVTKSQKGSNAFYFQESKLIKVEEYFDDGEKRIDAEWYYADDKPVYYTLQSDKSEERALFLLSMSKTLLKAVEK